MRGQVVSVLDEKPEEGQCSAGQSNHPTPDGHPPKLLRRLQLPEHQSAYAYRLEESTGVPAWFKEYIVHYEEYIVGTLFALIAPFR